MIRLRFARTDSSVRFSGKRSVAVPSDRVVDTEVRGIAQHIVEATKEVQELQVRLKELRHTATQHNSKD